MYLYDTFFLFQKLPTKRMKFFLLSAHLSHESFKATGKYEMFQMRKFSVRFFPDLIYNGIDITIFE